MATTATQRGLAGEQLFAATVTLTSDGELELFKPLIDDDHTDIDVGPRGAIPALAIQVKTALRLDRSGLAVARAFYPGQPRQHPRFIYAVLYVEEAAVHTAWLVPSSGFNRLAYRGAGPKGHGVELEFMASPVREDRWAPFRCARMEVGANLLRTIHSLRTGKVPALPGSHVLYRRPPS